MVLPKVALDYLASKGITVDKRHAAMWDGEHSVAFTVASVSRVDLLENIKASLERALKNGTTFEAWQKKTVDSFVADKTWPSARGDMSVKERMRVVYETNLRSAYAQGSIENKKRAIKVMPYWQYIASVSARQREEHRAYYGLVIAATDPWWTHYYPPSDYGCKCGVIALTAARARAIGISKAPTIKWEMWKSGGKKKRVPVGVGPSFAYDKINGGYAARQAAVRSKAKWAR